MVNIHIVLNEFHHASRILKETRSIIEHGIADCVLIAALGGDRLDDCVEVADNIILKRFRLISRRFSKSTFVQFVKYIEYVCRILLFCRHKAIGMVNVHSLKLLPVGVMLRYLHHAKLVYDAHELETEKSGEGGARKKLSKLIEKWLIKYCDLVIVVSDSIADWYASEYGIERPVVVFNAPRYREPKPSNRLRKALNISHEKMIFLYQGGLVRDRGVDLILQAFTQSEDADKVVVFMGYGEMEEVVREAANKFSNIYYHPAVPPSEVLDFTASADVGIHVIRNTCLNHYYCLPNKFFEYLCAGLPVVVSNMREMAALVIRHSIGIVAQCETVESLVESIRMLNGSELMRCRINTLSVSRQYCWEMQEKKLIQAFITKCGI